MALGDKVLVLVDAGAGKVREEEVAATSAGGRIAVDRKDGWWEVQERTRNGTPKRTIRVTPERLVAIIDKPRS